MHKGRVLTAAVAAVFFLSGLLFRPVVVIGSSMEPALRHRQVVVLPRFCQQECIKRGDIVLFRKEGTVCVKRVAGVAGDLLKIAHFENGLCLVAADPASENEFRHYKACYPDRVSLIAFRVPEGTVYVLGDNISASIDSRDFGPVSISEIRGTVCPLTDALRRPLERGLAIAHLS